MSETGFKSSLTISIKRGLGGRRGTGTGAHVCQRLRSSWQPKGKIVALKSTPLLTLTIIIRLTLYASRVINMNFLHAIKYQKGKGYEI